MRSFFWAGCAAFLSACAAAAPPAAAALVHLEAAPAGAGFRLTLIAAPGARINARLKPVLELDQGGRLTFEAAALTADSAYFMAPPTADVARAGRIRGRIRVGVCPAGMNVCRAIVLPVDTLLGG